MSFDFYMIIIYSIGFVAMYFHAIKYIITIPVTSPTRRQHVVNFMLAIVISFAWPVLALYWGFNRLQGT